MNVGNFFLSETVWSAHFCTKQVERKLINIDSKNKQNVFEIKTHVGDHHTIPGRSDGCFDIAGVFRSENGHNVLAHHLREGLGGEQQVGPAVVKLQDQRDTVG